MTLPAPPWQRAARSRTAKPPLSRDAIVDAAVMIALLRCGGVSDRTAAFAVDLLSLYATATACEETIYIQRGMTEESVRERFAQMREYLESLPVDRFPNVVSMVGPLL